MNQNIPLPTERSFGAVFVAVFAIVTAVGLWRHSSWWMFPAVLAVATLLVTLVRPMWLRPLNRQWMRLASVLNMVFSPIVLGLMFFGVFTPIAFVMRLAGRDTMGRRFEPSRPTYWIPRDPPGPDRKSLPNQF